jgi:glycosyltransferase involved in cell wall biosynthesis
MRIRMSEAKVRVLISLHQGGGAGSVNSTLHLALGLARRGLLVRFVCPPDSPVEVEARAGGLEVHPLPLRSSHRFANARRLRQLLERHPVDLINSQGSKDREAFIWLGLTRRLPAPLILTRRTWPRSTWLELRLGAAVAARVIAVSDSVAGALERGGVPRARIRVIPNGVILARLDRAVAPAEVRAWRERIGWEPSRRTVGIVARPKDQDVVVRALEFVRAPVRLVLAGLDEAALGRPLPPAPARHAVVRLPYDPAIRPLYELLEVALHPSHREAMPQAVLEAMALGKPVIASNDSGNAGIIRHEIDGLLAAPHDPAAWGAALDRVLADGRLAERLGEAARRRAREDFALSHTVDRTIAVYEEVLAGRSAFRVPRSEFP